MGALCSGGNAGKKWSCPGPAAPGAPLCSTGCGKPAFAGKVGNKCRKSCPGPAAGAICITPMCGKPTFNGQIGFKCSKSCGAGYSPGAPLCSAGCGKPAFAGKVGNKCRKSCQGPAAGAICITPMCGKPTWNGKPGEKCRRSCGAGAGAICITPMCGKPTFNGKPGEKCRRSCGAGAGATCITPLCGKPTFNGKIGFKCSKSCGAGAAICTTPGCGKPTFDGQPGNKCRRSCAPSVAAICVTPGCGKPTWNGKNGERCGRSCGGGILVCRRGACSKPTWNGKSRGFCSHDCRAISRKDRRQLSDPTIEELEPGDPTFENVLLQFKNSWDTGRCPVPRVAAMFEIIANRAVCDRYNKKAAEIEATNPGKLRPNSGPGNENRRWHGARLDCTFSGSPCGGSTCTICDIISGGTWDMSKLMARRTGRISDASSVGYYGDGIYFTSRTATAKGYSLRTGLTPPPANVVDFVSPGCGNALLLCKVLVGTAEHKTVTKGGKDEDPPNPWYKTTPPPGIHSRIVDKRSGSTPVDELVLFDEKQALPTYLVIV